MKKSFIGMYEYQILEMHLNKLKSSIDLVKSYGFTNQKGTLEAYQLLYLNIKECESLLKEYAQDEINELYESKNKY